MKECSLLIKKAEKKADIIEIWLDHIKDLDLPTLFKLQKTPFLIVQKSGSSKIPNLLQAATLGAKYIDLDLKTNPAHIPQFRSKKSKLIISYHNFKRTPSDTELKKITQKIKSLKPDILKIATQLNSHSDSLRLLSLLDHLTKSKQKAIILGMGKLGPINRLYGCYLGNYLTFAPLEQKQASASGQIPVNDLQNLKKII